MIGRPTCMAAEPRVSGCFFCAIRHGDAKDRCSWQEGRGQIPTGRHSHLLAGSGIYKHLTEYYSTSIRYGVLRSTNKEAR